MTDTTSAQDRVLIFDTTLRDGEQSPGATMTLEEKLEIAPLLDEMGVDIIEAGFPIASEGDFEAVSEIARLAQNAAICGLARASFKDIDRCWEAVRHARRPRIHTFIGTSPLHRAIPNLDMDQMAERIHDTVTHARNLCDDVQWSPMDATRTEHDYLCRVVRDRHQGRRHHDQHPRHRGLHRAARERRADPRCCWSGCRARTRSPSPPTATTTSAWRRPTRSPRSRPGARQIECTINGLGERAGNTALEEVVMAMKVRNDILPYRTGIDTTGS